MDRGVVVVTGGSRGIGASVARRAAQAGWAVCLTYRVDEAAASTVVGEIQRAGGVAVARRTDLAVEDEIVSTFAFAAGMGPITAMVANAGVVATRARVDQLDVARIRHLMEVNVVGSIICCREAVRSMSTRHAGEGGSIVLVSSAASRLGSPGEYVDYAASKGAVDTLGLGLAKEVAAEGIRVNVVRPGIIDTDIHASGGQSDRASRLGPSVPLGRAGGADEVAAAILWLLGDEASYCTGAVVDVTGGR